MKIRTIIRVATLVMFSCASYAQPSYKGPGKKNESVVSDGKSSDTYHALLIGVNEYQHPIKPLQYPVSDVQKFSVILKKYNFLDQNVQRLLNPTKTGIVTGIEGLRQRVKSNDNLLVYVSLHGRQSPLDGKYYWLARDAKDQSPDSWLSVEDFVRRLGSIANQNLLLIIDVCYGGKIFDSTPTIFFDEIKTKGSPRSNVIATPSSQRQVDIFRNMTSSKAISSGTDTQLVPDESIFAEELRRALDEYDFEYLLTSDLFQYVSKNVTSRDPKTVPVYGFIRQHKKDMGGDFVFYNPKGSTLTNTSDWMSYKVSKVVRNVQQVKLNNLAKGQPIKIEASGEIYTGNYVRYSTPAGKDFLDGLPFAILDSYDIVPAYPHAALMYRIAPETTWQLCGYSKEFTAPKSGDITIEFQVNDRDEGNNSGEYAIEILTKPR